MVPFEQFTKKTVYWASPPHSFYVRVELPSGIKRKQTKNREIAYVLLFFYILLLSIYQQALYNFSTLSDVLPMLHV